MNIFIKTIRASILPLIAILVILFSFQFFISKKVVPRMMASKREVFSTSVWRLKPELEKILLTKKIDTQKLDEFAKSLIKKDSLFVSLSLLDAKLRTIYSSIKETEGNINTNFSKMDILEEKETLLIIEEKVFCLLPLKIKSKNIKALMFENSLKDVIDFRQTWINKAQLTSLILAFLFLLVNFIAIRKNIKIINVILDKFSLLKSGDFYSRLENEDTYSKEFAEGFNEMVETLKSNEDSRRDLLNENKDIASQRYLPKLFEQANEYFKSRIGVDKIIFFLVKDEDLIVSAKFGFEDELVENNDIFEVYGEIFNEVFEYGRPVIIDKVEDTHIKNYKYQAICRQGGSFLLMPILNENELFGIIHISKQKNCYEFKESEIAGISMFADGIAIALGHLLNEKETDFNINKRSLGEIRKELEPTLSRVELESFQIIPAKQREFDFLTPYILTTRQFDYQNTSEVFFIGDRRKGKSISIFVTIKDPTLATKVFGQIKGMMSILDITTERTNNLFYFSSSILQKMKPSKMRDDFIQQFSNDPYTADGLKTLIESALEDIEFELFVVTFDFRNRTYETSGLNLELFNISKENKVTKQGSNAKFLRSDIILGIPNGLLTENKMEKLNLQNLENDTLETLLEAIDQENSTSALNFPHLFVSRALNKNK